MQRGNGAKHDRMNTKVNSTPSSGVHRRVGRQVGVLPLPTRPRLQNTGSSGRRRPAGLGRQTSGASAPSQAQTGDDSEDDLELSFRLTDKPLSSRSSSSSFTASARSSARSRTHSGAGSSAVSSARSSTLESPQTPTREKKTFSQEEILERCQEEDFYKVYEIDLHGEGLTEIGDIEKFRKLRILDVSCNHIRQIGGLEFAKELKELKLYDNELRTIENLHNSKELSTLQLQYNRIRTVGRGLKEQRKLKNLRLDFNQICKLETSELVPLAQLTVLNISNNHIDDLTAVNYLPCLEELVAAGNRLSKVAPLQGCKRLSDVDLSRNRLTDLSGLANIHSLQILNVSANQISTLKSLGRLKSLEELNVNRNRLTSLSELKDHFPKLQILCVEDNSLSAWREVESLQNVPDLVELSVAGNPFCQEGGEKFHYLQDIHSTLPNIEMVDGANFKKVTVRPSGTPLMRPMTASGVISLRQMESQIMSGVTELETFERTMMEKFDSMRNMIDKLPADSPEITARNEEESASRPSSKASSRFRIREAQEFAAHHFD